MDTVSIAFEYENVVNIEEALHKANDNCYDYIIVPLVHPRFERQTFNGLPDRNLPLTRSDLLLNSSSWNQNIVGKFSDWANFDSAVEVQRHNARKVCRSLNRHDSPFPGVQTRSCLGHTHRYLCRNFARGLLGLC